MMILDPQNANSLTGPPAIDGIGTTGRMDEYWKEADATRRKKSAWAA
jgi:phthalate 4,5-dioxygenase